MKHHVTVTQAAELLGISRWKFRQYLYAGRIEGAVLKQTLRGPVWEVPLTDGKPVILPKKGGKP